MVGKGKEGQQRNKVRGGTGVNVREKDKSGTTESPSLSRSLKRGGKKKGKLQKEGP